MWPAEVEEVAAAFRAAGVDARLEELAKTEQDFHGPFARAVAYDCDGRVVVALLPAGRSIDLRRLARVAQCPFPARTTAPVFPFRGAAAVLVDRLLLRERAVWIDAGAPRYAVCVSPAQLARLVRAETVELVEPA